MIFEIEVFWVFREFFNIVFNLVFVKILVCSFLMMLFNIIFFFLIVCIIKL